LVSIPSKLHTSEGHGWFFRRSDRSRAVQFLAFLTLADAHRLSIMQELRIGRCWSTDCHPGLDGVPLAV
jgi:hypothetical protein